MSHHQIQIGDRLLLVETLQLRRVVIFDEVFEQGGLPDTRTTNELDVNVSVARTCWTRGRHAPEGRHRLHGRALQQLLVPGLRIGQTVLRLRQLILYGLHFSNDLGQLCILFLKLRLQIDEKLRIDDYLRRIVYCLRGLIVRFLQFLVLQLHLLDRLLLAAIFLLQGLFFRHQLQLYRLQLLISLSQLAHLFRSLLIFRHQRTDFLGFLFQLLQLLFRKVHAPSLLGQLDRSPQHAVHLFFLPTPPTILNPPGSRKELVSVDIPTTNDTTTPGLNPHDSLQDISIRLLASVLSHLRLNPCSEELTLQPQELKTGLSGTKQRLKVPKEESDGRVHLPGSPAPPTCLDQRRALDEQLEAGKLEAFVHSLLEEHQSSSNGPGKPTLINVQLHI